MKYIGLFVAVLEPLKPTVRKNLLSDSVHVNEWVRQWVILVRIEYIGGCSDKLLEFIALKWMESKP